MAASHTLGPCDLADMDAIAAMADKVLADLGGVNILTNGIVCQPWINARSASAPSTGAISPAYSSVK